MADSHAPADLAEPWTDEKHVWFLNAIEASFVRKMLQKRRCFDGRGDAYISDGSKPISCLRPQQRLASASATNITKAGDHDNTRSKSSGPYDASEDQVVPRLDRSSGDKGESDYPIVPFVSN